MINPAIITPATGIEEKVQRSDVHRCAGTAVVGEAAAAAAAAAAEASKLQRQPKFY
jgi:hypothetical protein